ncbi:hypothetical protein SAMN05518672_1011225 [Chitinophaga sp. CF118]|uniref:DUF6452 family protein n=1 Tax=Chitinophaga sp. CF118 TaxID=1884367 RepID=UPI0008E3D373|nr:DUF6452 family protein [Chitinophaga sp. CF118]SFD24328.1 hypothetical protein SAMN05518672_1011225 [Chitinophaga sp. CF118]
MKYISGIIAILLLSVFAACEDETKTCDQTLIADLGINFKKDTLDGFLVKDTAWPKVTLMALNKDTILSNALRSSVFVSLSPLSDTSSFYLKLDSTKVADTLTFLYTRKPNFVSAGCGFATFFTLDTVISTHHTIDSIHINNKEVNSSNDTHLSLFFIFPY